MLAEKVEITRPYESVIIVHPDASEDEQKALFKKNKSIIEADGGEWNHLDTWGKRTLANEINKHRRATYFHCTFVAKPSTIAELERTMGINDQVLRFSHSKLDERLPVAKHLEAYREVIAASVQREKDREAKAEKSRRRRT